MSAQDGADSSENLTLDKNLTLDGSSTAEGEIDRLEGLTIGIR